MTSDLNVNSSRCGELLTREDIIALSGMPPPRSSAVSFAEQIQVHHLDPESDSDTSFDVDDVTLLPEPSLEDLDSDTDEPLNPLASSATQGAYEFLTEEEELRQSEMSADELVPMSEIRSVFDELFEQFEFQGVKVEHIPEQPAFDDRWDYATYSHMCETFIENVCGMIYARTRRPYPQSLSIFRSRGWDKRFVSTAQQHLLYGEDDLVRRREEQAQRKALQSKSAKAKPSLSLGKGSGVAPPEYAIFKKRGPERPRPVVATYSCSAMAEWAAGQATKLVHSYGPSRLPRYMAVCGNDSLTALCSPGFAGSKKALAHLLQTAGVTLVNFRILSQQKQVGPYVWIGHLTIDIPLRERQLILDAADVSLVFNSLQEVLDRAEIFKRDRPIFRSMCRYFADDLTFQEESSLRASLSSHFRLRPVCSPQKALTFFDGYGPRTVHNLEELNRFCMEHDEFHIDSNILHHMYEFLSGRKSVEEEKKFVSYCRNYAVDRPQPVTVTFQGPAQSVPVSEGATTTSGEQMRFGHNVYLDLNSAVAAAPRVKVEHTVDVPVLHDIAQILKDMQVSSTSSTKRLLSQFSILLLSLYRSNSWMDFFLHATQFAMGIDVVWKFFETSMGKMWDLLKVSSFAFQAPGDQAPPTSETWFSQMWDTLSSSFIVIFCKELFSSIYSMTMGNVADLAKSIRFELLKNGAQTVAKMITDFFVEVSARIRSCIDQKSLDPLWGPRWDPSRWVFECESLMLYHTVVTVSGSASPSTQTAIDELRDKKVIPQWVTTPMTPVDLVEYLTSRHADGIKMKESYSSNPTLRGIISSVLSKLTAFLQVARVQAFNANRRPVPFMLYFWGEPGTGKTNIASAVTNAIGRACDYDTSPSSIYLWRTGVNFQDGLSHVQWAIHMDDIDQKTAPQSAAVQDHPQIVVDVVNDTPLPVEAAAVEDKGKRFARPLLVEYCSNYCHGQLAKRITDKDAFWRRVSYKIEVIVKDEFRAVGAGGATKQLDKEKASREKTHDMWDLRVYKFDPSVRGSSADADPFALVGSFTFPQFVKFVIKEFISHRDAQIKRLTCDPQMDYCPFCYLAKSSSCGCVPDLKLQGPYAPLSERWQAVLYRYHTWDDPFFDEATDDELGVVKPPLWKRMIISGGDVLLFGAQTGVNLAYDAKDFAAVASSNIISSAAEKAAYGADVFMTGCHNSVKSRVIRYQLKTMMRSLAVPLAGSVAICGIVILLARRLILQAREGNAMAGMIPKDWKRVEQEFVPGVNNSPVSTWTKEDLLSVLRKSYVPMIQNSLWPGVSKEEPGHCFVLTHNTLLVPTHYLTCPPVKGYASLVLGLQVPIKVQVTDLNFAISSVNNQLAVLRVPGLPAQGGILRHIPMTRDEQLSSLDECELWSNVELFSGKTASYTRRAYGLALTVKHTTKEGDCGAIYVGRVGKHWKLYGMHYAIETGVLDSFAMGCPLFQLDLTVCVSKLGTTFQGVRDVTSSFVKEGEVEFSPLPAKSEAWCALTAGARLYPLGEMSPRPFGASYKSSVTPSKIAEHFRDLEEEICGQKGYWRAPDFKGKMVEGEWRSLYQDSLLAAKPGAIREDILTVALMDYLSGLEDLDLQGYNVISQYEAIVGRKEAWINPMNPKTSVGPPFNAPKTQFFAKVEDEVYEDPRIAERYQEICDILSSGDIPGFVGRCIPKDEAIKPDKYPRVFTVFAAVANLIQKQYFTPGKVCMRANPTFFESWVGIDMTSKDVMKLIDHLRRVNPDLDEVNDRDARKLDKCWQPEVWEAVAKIWYTIAFAMGLPNPLILHTLILALKYTRFELKGDVFVAFWNPSGCDITVELNGMFMSLVSRYVFYLERPDIVAQIPWRKWLSSFYVKPLIDPSLRDLLCFRTYCSLGTYGDDVLENWRKGCFPQNIQEVCLSHFGLVITDAKKRDTLRVAHISEASFLKRAFVWDTEVERFITPIDKRTIVRMLVCRHASTLSENDYACVAMMNALRECVYHGEEFYERIYKMCVEAADIYELKNNGYWHPFSYDLMRQKIFSGEFSTWELPELDI